MKSLVLKSLEIKDDNRFALSFKEPKYVVEATVRIIDRKGDCANEAEEHVIGEINIKDIGISDTIQNEIISSIEEAIANSLSMELE